MKCDLTPWDESGANAAQTPELMVTRLGATTTLEHADVWDDWGHPSPSLWCTGDPLLTFDSMPNSLFVLQMKSSLPTKTRGGSVPGGLVSWSQPVSWPCLQCLISSSHGKCQKR